MNTLNLPTNGALMSDEQFNLLRWRVDSQGSALEKAMMQQIEVLAVSVVAWRRSQRTEWDMRLEAETALRELTVQAQKTRTILSTPTSKLNKADLLGMIKKALAELPEVEVERE